MGKLIKIFHIVPTSYGGGVETAAKSFLNYSTKNFIFKVIFLRSRKLDNPIISYIFAMKRIFDEKPDIILTSLWKSNLMTLIYKLFLPNKKYILFIHSTKNKHFLDKFITSFAAFYAYEIWADAEYSLEERLKSLYLFNFKKGNCLKIKQKRVISFVTEKLDPISTKNCCPSFIYWGRLSSEKNIDKAIQIFSKICKTKKESTFIIIGPDYGVRDSLNTKIIDLNLIGNVFIYDYMSLKEIKTFAKDSSFFIQLSSYEGMAMSVAESMQLGLIPVVSAVGQIKFYCKNMKNSLIYNHNDQDIISNISLLISSPKIYENIRNNAIKTWQDSNTYRLDIISALDQLLKSI